MFTLDWYGHEDAEEAGHGGHECAQVIALDNGNFAAQPNNRIQWSIPPSSRRSARSRIM